MSQRKTYTFKCSDTIQAAVSEIMDTWQLDRTSVIKLALFQLSAYLQKEEVKSLSLYELVEEMERQTPPDFPSYALFDNN